LKYPCIGRGNSTSLKRERLNVLMRSAKTKCGKNKKSGKAGKEGKKDIFWCYKME